MPGSAAAKHNTAAACSRLSRLQSSCHYVKQKQTTKDTREKEKYIKDETIKALSRVATELFSHFVIY